MFRCFRLRSTMMQRYWVLGCLVPVMLAGAMQAQGTKLWSVDRYDTMERGTAEGVAIRSDGRLEAGPAKLLVYDSGKSYAWSLASDRSGNAYLGLGGSTAGSGIVMRIAGDGKAEKILETKELAVQALAVAPEGSVLAATSPDGKVYRVPTGATSGTVLFDPAATEEKPKYLWGLAAGKNGEVYVAAGAPAVVYRVPAGGGKAEVLFKTADQHIRCLLMAPDGTLWAGSDGAGVIYRIDTTTAGAKPFAAYAASRREITSLATDESGNIYAAGVGAKGSVPLPPLPVTGNVGITVTFAQPGSSTAAGSNTLVPEGSEIDRIARDGTPQQLLSMKGDVVYALAFRNGELLAATGNRGRIYRVEIGVPGEFTDVTHLDAAQGMAFASVKDGLLVATSNSGKLFRLSDTAVKEPTYTSEVFDAQGFSKWGRVEARAEGGPLSYELWLRSGNVPSPLMGWSEWTRIGADGAVTAPPGRYAQWKAVLHPRSAVGIDAVGLNYLPRNIAPLVDEIVVQPGARVPHGGGVAPNTTVQVAFPQPAGATPVVSFQPDASVAPLTAQKDKNAITARWQAHDENGDDLMFAVWYRGVGEKNWRLLKDKISDRFYSFDASLLPDGSYELKVVASDAPVHTDSETLQGERVSPVFVVDTTPPVPGPLAATLVPGGAGPKQKIHATLEAHDATSPIAHAEYSIDAGPWQYLEPVGQVSDSQTERYDFTTEIPQETIPVLDAKEHVIAVRIYDRYENMAAVKAVVR
jgi:sugar lactone lactonase YvrE